MILSVPILGFIYGPVAENPKAASATRFIVVPIVILSGLWLWNGHVIRRWMLGLRPAAAERVGTPHDR